MTDSTIIEILLAVLALMIGVGSFIGATRASKAQSDVAIINIDAQAYERAQQIYESAISTLERRVTSLEGQVERLNTQNDELSRELARLRRENDDLRKAKSGEGT
jgi:predicted RNase H-like nuclease (RuvC/YqgF family)